MSCDHQCVCCFFLAVATCIIFSLCTLRLNWAELRFNLVIIFPFIHFIQFAAFQSLMARHYIVLYGPANWQEKFLFVTQNCAEKCFPEQRPGKTFDSLGNLRISWRQHAAFLLAFANRNATNTYIKVIRFLHFMRCSKWDGFILHNTKSLSNIEAIKVIFTFVHFIPIWANQFIAPINKTPIILRKVSILRHIFDRQILQRDII